MKSKFKETEIGVIPESWELVSLENLIDIKHGFAFKGKFFSEEEGQNILLTPGNFKIGGGFNDSKFKYYTGEIPEDYILKKDDIIVTMTDLSKEGDTLGYPAKIPFSLDKKYLHNQRLGLLKFKSNKIMPEFLYWKLRNHDYRHLVLATASGTTVKHTSPSRILKIEIALPPSNEQYKIAKILSSIENKILINQKMNQTLEEIGQALFKHWFVHFEFPNEEGKHYKSSGGEMVDSELGEIPKGWEVFTLGDLCSSISETYNLKNKSAIFFLNTGDIFDGKVINHQFADVESLPGQAKKKICKNDILYSEIRPANRRFAFVDFDAEEYVVSTKLMVLRSNDNITPELLFQFLKMPSIIEYFQGLAESRSGTFPQITFDTIKHIQIALPNNKDDIIFLGSIFSYILKIVNQNVSQNKSLTKIRDSLLPKLMSGKIRVK